MTRGCRRSGRGRRAGECLMNRIRRLFRPRPNNFLKLLGQQSELTLPVLRLEAHPGVANDHAQRAKALENRVEDVYREAIAALFSGPQDLQHVVEMLKMREVYRHLSNAADRGDQAANVICDIVVKMT